MPKFDKLERMRLKLGGLLATVLIASSACTNIFTTFSNEQSDAALLVSAHLYNDQNNYSAALALFPQMSLTYQNRRDVIALWASAYAGEAGLDFLTFAKAIQNIGSTNLFLFIMQQFDTGTTGKMAEMQAAQNKLLTISTTMSDLTNDELMELVAIGIGNMGTIMSTYEDTNHDGAGDGATCNKFPAYQTPIPAAPNDAIRQFGVSLNYVLAALTQLSANGVSFGPSSLGQISTQCGLLPAADNFCGIYDASVITQAQNSGILTLMNEKTAGIGLATCNGSVTKPACICP